MLVNKYSQDWFLGFDYCFPWAHGHEHVFINSVSKPLSSSMTVGPRKTTLIKTVAIERHVQYR